MTGKGGVGKSTIATALALAAAHAGARPLLVEAGTRASLREIVGTTLGPDPTALGDGVHGMSLAGDAAILAFAADVLHSRRLARLLLAHRSVGPLIAAMPAVAEVAATHVLAKKREYAPLVVDLEATGHARMWFELRETLSPVIQRGPIAELLERAHAELVDPACTGLVVVTRPEPLAISEALELCEELRQRGGVQPRAILVNATCAVPSHAAADRDALLQRARAAGATEIVADLELLARRAAQVEREHAAAAPLADTGAKVVWLPRMSTTDRRSLLAFGVEVAASLFEPPPATLPEAVAWT